MGKVIDTAISGMPIKTPAGNYLLSFDPRTGQLVLDSASGGMGGPSKPGSGAPNGPQPPSSEKEQLPSEAMKTVRVAIERLLRQNRVGGRYTTGHAKGKLDMHVKSLVRGSMGSKAIRKQKDLPTVGYNFMFLVDASGSMGGEKIVLANRVLQSLVPALDIDGVSTAVLSFDSGLRWVKDWNQGKFEPIEAGGSNHDYEALRYVLTEGFKGSPERRKNVLIMLSDGEPCSGALGRVMRGNRVIPFASRGGSESISEIQTLVRTRSRHFNIVPYGIGILQGGHQIPRHTVLKDLSGLQPLMERIVRELV